MAKLDIKTIGGWLISLLIVAFGVASTSSFSDKKTLQDNDKLDAAQQVEINELKRTVRAIETSTADTRDNVIMLMYKEGLTPKKTK